MLQTTENTTTTGRGRPRKTGWPLLVELREAKGLSQQALAKACGLWLSQIGRWERGEVAPDWKYLPVLADVLGVSKEDLAKDIANIFCLS